MLVMPNLWEKRWSPLRREWVVYAAHRNARPWEGESVQKGEIKRSFEPSCYLCPGNQRANSKQNPKYEGVYVFDNDFPVVGMNAPLISAEQDQLYQKASARGFAKVICYDQDHSKSMSDLSERQMVSVLKAWKSVTQEAKDLKLTSAFIFENKGEMTGVSNLHPHCQVYATDFVFQHIERELGSSLAYDGKLFSEIIAREIKEESRVIYQNETAIAFIPFFAKYPFEVMLFPKREASNFLELSDKELEGMAEVYLVLIKKYDALYNMSFPYVMSVMQAPLQSESPHFQMYFHFQTPLRNPSVKKHLAGPEIGGGNFMADTIPEQSAEILRNAM